MTSNDTPGAPKLSELAGRRPAADPLVEAAGLLDMLETSGPDLALREHVEIFDSIHRALQDALAQAEH